MYEHCSFRTVLRSRKKNSHRCFNVEQEVERLYRLMVNQLRLAAVCVYKMMMMNMMMMI
jgi:hypothetical protein